MQALRHMLDLLSPSIIARAAECERTRERVERYLRGEITKKEIEMSEHIIKSEIPRGATSICGTLRVGDTIEIDTTVAEIDGVQLPEGDGRWVIVSGPDEQGRCIARWERKPDEECEATEIIPPTQDANQCRYRTYNDADFSC